MELENLRIEICQYLDESSGIRHYLKKETVHINGFSLSLRRFCIKHIVEEVFFI